MHAATDELATRATFKGYGPGTGYESVRSAIASNDFRARGADVAGGEGGLDVGHDQD